MNPATVPASGPLAKSKHSATISSWGEAIGLLSVLIVGTTIWLIPPPAGVQPEAWHLLAILVSTTTALVSLGVLLISGVLTWKDVLEEGGLWWKIIGLW